MIPPRTIFKYVNCSGISILSSGELRISDPSKVNDPFETAPMILPVSDELVSEKLADPEFHKNIAEMLLKANLIQHENEIPSFLETNREKFSITEENNMLSDFFNIKSMIASEFGFTSFSKTPVDILMWSHYSEYHRGFVLGFDSNIFNEDYCPREVIYSSHRIEYNSYLHSKTREYLFFKILRTKSLHWSYEQELRSILPRHICKKRNDGFLYYPFEKKDLKYIIFGVNCSEKLREDLLELVTTEYPHVLVFNAVLHKYRYEIYLQNH